MLPRNPASRSAASTASEARSSRNRPVRRDMPVLAAVLHVQPWSGFSHRRARGRRVADLSSGLGVCAEPVTGAWWGAGDRGARAAAAAAAAAAVRVALAPGQAGVRRRVAVLSGRAAVRRRKALHARTARLVALRLGIRAAVVVTVHFHSLPPAPDVLLDELFEPRCRSGPASRRLAVARSDPRLRRPARIQGRARRADTAAPPDTPPVEIDMPSLPGSRDHRRRTPAEQGACPVHARSPATRDLRQCAR